MPDADAAWTRLDAAGLDRLLDRPGTWSSCPPAADRGAWEARAAAVPDAAAAAVAAAAPELGEPWPALTARLARRFAATGDRDAFESVLRRRRRRLAACAAAEAVEGRGRFVDDLIDGLWSQLEEASWCAPAHYHLAIAPRTPVRPLPPGDRELVDIYAAQAGMLAAEAWWLHRDAIAERVGDALAERLLGELRRRIFEPVLRHDDWFWSPGQHNWSVWIAYGTARAASLVEDDRDRDRAVLARACELAGRFLAGYADDGGCDEGPGYWTHAAGSAFRLADLLHARSGGRIDPFAGSKLHAMCRYAEDVRLAGDVYFTVADCPPTCAPPVALVARMGERFDDDDLRRLAARGRETGEGSPERLGDWLDGFWHDRVAAPPAAPRPLLRWWSSLQLLVARSDAEDGRGMVCAVKAGSNAESHNHNDVGEVVVVLDGRPAIVDPGVGSYTRDHFSPRRYAVWTQGGDAHAVPKVNGHPQHAATGWGYVADEAEPRPVAEAVAHRGDEAREVVTMDLAACYPRAAGLRRLVRTATFDRAGGTLTVADEVACAAGPCTVELGLPTPGEAAATADGFRIAVGERDLMVRVAGEDPIELAVEEVPLEDPKLVAGWGSALRRLVVRVEARGAACAYRLHFEPAPSARP